MLVLIIFASICFSAILIGKDCKYALCVSKSVYEAVVAHTEISLKLLRYSWRVCTKVFYALLVFLRAVYVPYISFFVTYSPRKKKGIKNKYKNIQT